MLFFQPGGQYPKPSHEPLLDISSCPLGGFFYCFPSASYLPPRIQDSCLYPHGCGCGSAGRQAGVNVLRGLFKAGREGVVMLSIPNLSIAFFSLFFSFFFIFGFCFFVCFSFVCLFVWFFFFFSFSFLVSSFRKCAHPPCPSRHSLPTPPPPHSCPNRLSVILKSAP